MIDLREYVYDLTISSRHEGALHVMAVSTVDLIGWLGQHQVYGIVTLQTLDMRLYGVIERTRATHVHATGMPASSTRVMYHDVTFTILDRAPEEDSTL